MEKVSADIHFLEALNKPSINIPRAALGFARSIAYPKLDVPAYLARLDALADAARPYVQDAGSLTERTDALSTFLFDKMQYRGNHTNYYDPYNSFLNCVLDRKLGIPITLAVIYVSIAQRVGMRAYGISLPGHFIAGVYENGSEVLLDPFDAGRRLTAADCARLVRDGTGFKGPFQQKWLSPSTPTDVVARMLTNLCNAYIQMEDWNSAIPVIQHLLIVQPDAEHHLRNLGYVYLYDGSLRLSADLLEQYLRRAPKAGDFDSVLNSLKIVAARLALWN